VTAEVAAPVLRGDQQPWAGAQSCQRFSACGAYPPCSSPRRCRAGECRILLQPSASSRVARASRPTGADTRPGARKSCAPPADRRSGRLRRSPGRRSEVIIPRSSNRCSCSSINLWMWPQLNRGESNVTRQCDRRQPGLGRLVVSVNVFAYEGAARAAVALAAGLWPSEAPTLPADGAAEQARPRQTPALGVRSPGAGD